MAEYIERKDALAKCGWYNTVNGKSICAVRKDELTAIPTIDAIPVVHGRWDECDWVKYDGHSECIHYPKVALRCSNCCNAFKKELLWKDNYCPNCGADMRGE